MISKFKDNLQDQRENAQEKGKQIFAPNKSVLARKENKTQTSSLPKISKNYD